MVTSGAIRREKLQSNCHQQQTNIQIFTCQMPILSPNQQWQGLRVIGSEVSAADFPFAGKPDVASVIPFGTFRVVHVLANAVRRSCAVGVTGMDLLTTISPGIIQTRL